MNKQKSIKESITERFFRYVKIDTQSNEESKETPSTKTQFDLANLLAEELRTLNLIDVSVNENCYVMATLPANCDKETSKIGFIAHLDTAPGLSGKDVKPRIIDNYSGGDVLVNEECGVCLKPAECPELSECTGHTLIVGDGTTLLGADDKAGITAIMAAVEFLTVHPEILHGTIRIAFTPDEEIGKGAEHFDLLKFDADFAYTIDGGFTGELNKETFSANSALIEVKGRDIHPGTAKNIMVNSVRCIADIISQLPAHMAPECTDGYEPFIHPLDLRGDVGAAQLKLILRDFNDRGLDIQRKMLEEIICNVQNKYPKAQIKLTIKETYRNMRYQLEKFPEITQRLWNAAVKAGVNPHWEPVRGGTDGSRLTAMGLPTPNIFTGSGNHHSITEWLSVDALEKTVETIINIASITNIGD